MKKLIALITTQILICFVCTTNLIAQTPDTITVSQLSPAIGGCMENRFSASVSSNGSHFTIAVSLSTGDTNSACSPDERILIVVDSIIGTYTNAVTDTANNSWVATLTSASTVIYYKILLDCSIGLNAGSNSTYNLIQTFTDASNQYSYIVAGEANNTLSTSFQIPQLVNVTGTQNFQVGYLTPRYLNFYYKNTNPTIPLFIKFTFNPDATPNYYNQLVDLGFSFRDTSGTSFTSFSTGNEITTVINPLDTLCIRQLVSLNDCLNDSGNVSASLTYRCSHSPTDNLFCSECNGISFVHTYKVSQTTDDRILVNRVLPAPTPNDNSCPNDTSQSIDWHYRFTNSGGEAIDTMRFVFKQLGAFPNSINFLSLVSKQSVRVQTKCTQCAIIDTTFILKTASLCTTSVTDALSSARVAIKDFGVNDTLEFFFTTFKCSEENDSLYNQAKYYSRWSFDSLKTASKSVCNGIVTIQEASPNPPNRTFWGSNYISNLDNPPGYDFNLQTDFYPTKTDLSVPSGQTFGDSSIFSINLKGLIEASAFNDYNLLGCNNQPNNCTLQGYLRISVKTAVGLRIKDPSTHANLKLTNPLTGSSITAIPIYWHTASNPNLCTASEWFYYYNLSDSAMKDFLDRGTFEFKLQACCANTPDQTPYEVKFCLLANPNSCVTLNIPTNNIDTLTFSPTYAQWLPLRKNTAKIIVHCPGCAHPGIIVDKYNMQRSSFGLQDSDNDSRADAGLPQINTNSTWYNNFEQLLRTNASSFGDRVTDYTSSHFQDGEFGIGYTYSQMTAIGANLPVLQLSRIIPMGFDTFALTVDSIYLYIDAPNTTTPNCINCSEFEDDPAKWRTQREVRIGGANLATFLSTGATNNVFLFTFTAYDSSGTLAGTLHQYPSLYFNNDATNPFTTFEINQQYRLKVTYRVCGNWQPNPLSLVLEDYIKEINIQNTMFLSGDIKTTANVSTFHQALNTVAELNDSLNITLDTSQSPPMNLMDTAYTNHYLFFCETYGGRFYHFASQIQNNSRYFNTSACTKTLRIEVSTNIANFDNKVVNAYPYEYRPPILGPENYSVQIPSGYTITAARTQMELDITTPSSPTATVGVATNWQAFTPPSNTGLVAFNNTVFAPALCIDTNTTYPFADTTAYIGDQYTNRIIEFTLQKQNCDSVLVVDDSSLTVSFNGVVIPCLNINTNCTANADTLNLVEDGVFINVPHLNAVYNQTDITVTKRTVCDSITFTNVPVSLIVNTESYLTAAANFIYIAVPSATTVPYLSNWQFIPTNGAPINVIGQVIPVSPSLANDTTKITGRLCASYISCLGDSVTDTISIYTGWNCNNYPTTPFSPSNTCMAVEQQITLQDGEFKLENFGLEYIGSGYYLCDTIQYLAKFSSTSDGTFYPQNVFLTNIPTGLTILSASAYQPGAVGFPNSDTVGLNPVNSFTWSISIDSLNAIGITDGEMALGKSICILVTVVPTCSFSPPRAFADINLEGVTFCNDTVVSTTADSTALFDPEAYVYQGSHCTDCFSVTKTVDTTHAASYSDIVQYSIEICNKSDTTLTLAVTDTLPANFVITFGSIPSPLTLNAGDCSTINLLGYFTQANPCSANYNQVWVANNATGTTVTDSVCVTTYLPCSDSTTMLLNHNVYSTSLPNTFYTTNFYLKDTLFVNDTLQLFQCKMIVDSGAQIVVLDSGVFYLNETVIEGCTHMWRGVVMRKLLSSSPLIPTMELDEESYIKDANIAIFAHDKSKIKSHYSYFHNNMKGIFVPQKNGTTSVNGTQLEITRTVFAMIAPAFKNRYAGQNTSITIPHSGIELNDWAGTIGSNSSISDKNQFINMNNGIIAYRCNGAIVRNSFFDNIHIDPSYLIAGISFGYAITSTGTSSVRPGNLTVYPRNDNTNATIAGCYGGVYANYSSLTIDTTIISVISTGIKINSCTHPSNKIKITGNSIYTKSIGIDSRANTVLAATGDSIIVRNNTIVVSPLTAPLQGNGYGVYLSEGANSTTKYFIWNNTINLNGASYGVYGGNLKKNQITGNNITQTTLLGSGSPPLLCRGIFLSACDSVLVSCNHITWTGSNLVSGLAGMYIVNSTNSNYHCNEVTNQIAGFRFEGGCAGTSYKANTMNNNFTGLNLGTNASIGQQVQAGNIFNGNFGYNISAYNGANNLNNVGLGLIASRFTVIDTMAQSIGGSSYYYPKLPRTAFSHFTYIPLYNDTGLAVGSDDWFVTNPSGSTESCLSINACSADTTSNANRSYEMMIANEQTETVDFKPESKSMAEQYLFEKLSEDATLLNTEVAYTDFYTEKQNESIGKLYAVEYKSSNEIYSSQYLALIEQAKNLLNSNVENLNNLNILAINNPTVNYNLQIQTAKANIANLEVTLVNLNSQRQYYATGKYDEALQINSIIIPEELPEENLKIVNEAYLNVGKYGEGVAPNYFGSIFPIAMQCPQAGGKAVSLARAFLSFYYPDWIDYDDENTCLQFGFYRKVQDQTTINKKDIAFAIVPNPAQNELVVHIQNPLPVECKLLIFNASNQIVMIQNIDCNREQNNVDLSKLKQGFYFVKIKSNDGYSILKKLVIIK